MKPVMLDYETFYIKNEYSIKGLGNWRYCHDERFDPYLLSVYDGEQSWVGHPKDFNWDALEDCLLLAHNAGFDSSVTDALVEAKVAPLRLLTNPWQCTANMTSCLASSRSLAEAMFVLERKQVSKDIRDKMNGMTWRQMQEAGMDKQVVEYAQRDSVDAFGLWQKYSPQWSDFEQRVSQLTMKQCKRGVAIDKELLDVYRGLLQEVIFNLVKGFPWTAKGAKPTSPIAIAEQCRIAGIPAPPIKTKDEEGFSEWETTWGPLHPWVYGAGQWRSLNKLLGSLDTVKERLRPDGSIDFSLLYFGGHTGRWSGGGSGFNLQNLRKEPLFIKAGCMVSPPAGVRDNKQAFKDWRATLDHELDIRRLLVARPGKKFVIPDLAQIEPRVLNWLAGNHRLLEKIASGFSYYEAYAQLYKGWKGAPGTIKKELGDKGYTLLKNECLGLGYGMGAERYIDYVKANGGEVSMEQAEQTVATFRENNPLVTGLWAKLGEGIKKSTGGNFEMELPSGRKMVYRDVLREVRTKLNKETKKPEKRFVWTAKIGSKRFEFYGGALTENLVQATARDVFADHLLALEEKVGPVIFSVHDEAIVEVDKDMPKQVAEEVMCHTPEWLPGCPIASEAKETTHYTK